MKGGYIMGEFVIESYDDLCDESGFQFEFRCEKCGRPFKSEYVKSRNVAARNKNEKLGNAAAFLGGLFGGKAGELGDLIDRGSDFANEMAGDRYEKEKQAAFEAAEAIAEKSLSHCSRCGCWFCSDCYDKKAGMCKDCAEEVAQEERDRRQEAEDRRREEEERIEEEKREAEERRREEEERAREEAEAAAEEQKHICPKCGARVPDGMRFCGNCGTAMIKVCPKCGAENDRMNNFCQECGAKLK